MPPTDYRPIYEDDDLIVFLKNTDHDVAIFAFNNYGTIYPTPKVWGTDFIDRTGFKAVVFMAKQRNWFPDCAMSPAMDAVRRHLAPPAFSFTFGNSMGGYAAIRYARPLGADACLGFNPQYTIGPASQSFDRRFASYWTPDLAGMDIAADDIGPNTFVFYDPANREDAGHVRAMSELADIHEVKVFHTGHVTVRSVVLGSTIGDMIDIIRAPSSDMAAQVRILVRARKKSSFDYYQLLAKALVARRQARRFSLLVDFMERHSRLKEARMEQIRQLAFVPPPPAIAEEAAGGPPSEPPRPVDPPSPPVPGGVPAPLAGSGLPRFAGLQPSEPSGTGGLQAAWRRLARLWRS